MADSREPGGALPREIYMRRRIVAGIGLVLVLVIAYFLIFSPSGDGDDAATDTTTTPAPTVSSDPTTSAAPVDASRACTDADVQLTLTPNPFEVAAGGVPSFDVAIQQVGASPCSLNTDADSSLVVWSGGESNRDIYFDSTYCESDATITSRQMVLDTGAAESLTASWNRIRVGEGCTQGASAGEGYYWAQVTLQGIASEPAQFHING